MFRFQILDQPASPERTEVHNGNSMCAVDAGDPPVSKNSGEQCASGVTSKLRRVAFRPHGVVAESA